MSSNARHRAAPPVTDPTGKRLMPLLYVLGGLIALSGIAVGGAGLLGAIRL